MTTNFRLSAMALALSAAWPALAQQAPATPPASEDESQRVVITANKRAEKQREVAGTVSVISGSDLERRGARDQEDFLKLTPGVQLNRGDPNNNGITIRGLSSQASPESGGAQQNPSGRYLEDVPLASPIGKGRFGLARRRGALSAGQARPEVFWCGGAGGFHQRVARQERCFPLWHGQRAFGWRGRVACGGL